MEHAGLILIIDFGSQYTQLIARRIRESNIYCEIHPHTLDLDKFRDKNLKGVILSGGPMSVYDDGAPTIDEKVFELGVPVLGVCYGLQLIALKNGGKVEPAKDREYGKASINLVNSSKLLEGVSEGSIVWMSHGDYITGLPEAYKTTCKTDNSPFCSVENEEKKIYGLQFHPEVAHTMEGKKILDNFLFGICGCRADWTAGNFIRNSVDEIRARVGKDRAILALSGGVDSSVAALLLHKALGDELVCIHVDTGLMRKNESRDIVKMFHDNYNLNIIHIDATERFLKALEGVVDPEKKRKIIGANFIEVFEEEAKKYPNVKYLVQGTLYPDVIESVSVKGASVTIKTHHNVGGLPEKMHLGLIEPFRELFKDEVRAIGKELGLPAWFIERHPFPGPGLAVRVLGPITDERLEILREADDIYIEEIQAAGLYNEIWQAFAVLLPVQTVGVMGDARTYENVIALRAVVSTDGMTADWYRFDLDILEKISNRIIRSVRGVNRVVYDISSKPPSTIEWE